MKFLVLWLILQCQFINRPAFSERYQLEYVAAVQFCESIFPKADAVAKHFHLNREVLIPIVFPECIRYSVYKDRLETASLEVLYIDFGMEYADFSIGRFQMKPSFVEQIEQEVLKDFSIYREFRFIPAYINECNEKLVRAERIYRLKSLDWQLLYLCCYYRIVERKFACRNFNSIEDKISYYATAYNTGFWKEQKVIEHWQSINIFPGGKIDNINNYPYGKIAGEYYSQTKTH